MFDIKQLDKGAHIHFIGIGGISMSGLAQIMLSKGYVVTGSDKSRSHITDKLEKLGAVIYEGHAAENVGGADLVVHTAAVHDDNPEMQAAKAASIQLITRAEFLGSIMKLYHHAAGIAGTQGQTTTTSMLAHALIRSGLDPTISVGGELDIIGGNIKTGKSDFFITEACEYTNSFLEFFPTIAVITNIDADHLDFFSGIDEIIASFRKYALLTKGKGCVIASGQDANVKKALEETALDIKYYGIGANYEYHAENLKYNAGFPSFEIWHSDKLLCALSLKVPGEHNVLNALAAIAVCDVWGADIARAKAGIEEFSGAHRRFEKKGEYNGAVIMDDYAHHPTEIRATLKAAAAADHNRLWCVFQPHTYSRTRTLWKEFCESFDNVDELIITHIYAAREQPDGVTRAEDLAADIAKRGIKTRFIENYGEIENILKSELEPGDIAFTMGAGDVVAIADSLCK
ncbi:MAG: UDP-N-acetylmuramate--L-alanine ligase [Clostridiales bacterium]|nr:UDP-N-acetylmuramate--L-alanine ligase [Clostridiales bacterium]